MKQILLFITFCMVSFCGSALWAQKFEMDVQIKNYTNDTLVMGFYYGEKQLVKDTLKPIGKGKFKYTDTIMPQPGVYLLLIKPDNKFVQFLLDGKENNLKLTFDASNLTHQSRYFTGTNRKSQSSTAACGFNIISKT